MWALPGGQCAIFDAQPAVLWRMDEEGTIVQRTELGEILWYAEPSQDGTTLIGVNTKTNLVQLVDVIHGTIVTTFRPSAKVCALAVKREVVAMGLADGRVLTFRLHNFRS